MTKATLMALVWTPLLLGCSPQPLPPADGTDRVAAHNGEAAAEAEGGAEGAEEGAHPAYTMRFKDLEGNEVSLKDFKGKVVLLDLWATWCPPCVETIPKLEKLSHKYKERDLEVVGLNYDENPKKVNAFLKKKGATYHAWIGSVDDFEEMEVFGLPTAFLFGRSGKLIKKWVGYAEADEFAHELEQILKAQPGKKPQT